MTTLRTEQLLYFVEVAKQGSFSLAANQLHVAQPSISQAISNLEKELNVKLLIRSRAGIQLTAIGHSIFLKAQNILNMVEDIYDETRAQSHGIIGEIHIAAIPSICNTYLSDVLSAYKKKYPQVRIEVKEDGTNRIMQDVIANKVDIGLVSCQTNEIVEPKIEFSQLLTGTYVVYVGRNSTIPIQNPLPKELISKQPLIILQSGYRQEDYLKKLLGTDKLNILLTLGYTEAAKRIISQGIAVGFYADFSVKKDPYVKSGDIIPLEIEDNNFTLRFGWIRARNHRLTPAAQSFVKVLKEVIDESRP